jgi:hypothetical protein
MQQEMEIELEISEEEPTAEQCLALDRFWRSVIDRILSSEEEERLAA